MERAKGQEERLKVVLFCGGRGAATIATSLSSHPRVSLSLLINAYDDGLSTGRLRDFIPGMLGPSDIRKNFSRLIPAGSPQGDALKFLLEYRFPESATAPSALRILRAIADADPGKKEDPLLAAFERLSFKCAKDLAAYLKTFLEYYEAKKSKTNRFDFADCSLGNLVFAGAHLAADGDFNEAIRGFCGLHPIDGRVLNVTQGENLVLVALKQDGTILSRESEIVDVQSTSVIRQLFLLPGYLTKKELGELSALPFHEKLARLESASVTPKLNPLARQALEQADVIVYGPGTQHSSLLPSYVTRDLGNVVAANQTAEKVFVANARLDNEIKGESLNSLMDKLLVHLERGADRKLSMQSVVTHCFRQSEAETERRKEGLPFEAGRAGVTNVVSADWESALGVHLGGKVADELIALVNSHAEHRLRPLPYLVSIVVPILNEAGTIERVLADLRRLSFESLQVAKEIIVVDGGSTDGSYELCKKEKSARVFQLAGCKGRGHALRHGVDQARGDTVVFFPSDGEYTASDLLEVMEVMLRKDFNVVFGSRAVRCVNLPERLRGIYKGNFFGYLLSNWGGKLLSILSLLVCNRLVSDPLTGIKAFRMSLLRRLKLVSNSMDLDTEIIVKVSRAEQFILEIPVQFTPRRRDQGKKSTIRDGLLAIFAYGRFFRGKVDEETFDSRAGLQRGTEHSSSSDDDLKRAA